MKMHIDIIIVSNLSLDLSKFNNLNFKKFEFANIQRNYIITDANEKITFDYLIIDTFVPSLPILKENKHIITNQFFETSIENVFAIGEINSSKKSLLEQLNIICEYIQNPF